MKFSSMAGKPSLNAAADIRGQRPKAYQAATMGVWRRLASIKELPAFMTISLNRHDNHPPAAAGRRRNRF
jgi:hypothetical protein